MIAPGSSLMNSTVVVHAGATTRSVRGGVGNDSFGDGASYPAYVEAVTTTVNRSDSQGAPLGRKLYDVYTHVDLQVNTDSRIGWDGRKLSALGPSQNLSGADVLYRTECQEIT
ncbi:hypothetical protein [Singulisphaera sp. PoT]|uniref:hypothetical protein n=1 Tax=Singulisphaera sp. PoT TaxID=3411797 RepID=UPI003BF5BB22